MNRESFLNNFKQQTEAVEVFAKIIDSDNVNDNYSNSITNPQEDNIEAKNDDIYQKTLNNTMQNLKNLNLKLSSTGKNFNRKNSLDMKYKIDQGIDQPKSFD